MNDTTKTRRPEFQELKRIEIEFPEVVKIQQDDMYQLQQLVEKICTENSDETKTIWLSGMGCALKNIHTNPEFLDDVHQMECSARYEEEV